MSISEITSSVEVVDVDLDKKQQIAKIRELDRENFLAWLSSALDARTLDIPDEALRYLAIPERLFELVDDPSKLDVVAGVRNKTDLTVYVVEHRDEDLCLRDDFDEYLERRREYNAEAVKYTLKERADKPVKPEKPAGLQTIFSSDVDHLIQQGMMGLNDFVCLYESFSVCNNTLKVSNFVDREETLEGVKLRGNKVAKSFYLDLRERAAAMGFDFILGENDKDNLWFFKDKLGRVTLDDIKPEKWEQLTGLSSEEIADGRDNAQFVTIDILNEDLRAEFIL